MDVLAYVISSLAILWSFGGGQLTHVFWTRILIAAPICLAMALLLLKNKGEIKSIKPNPGSWMMGVGVGFVMFIVGLVLAWFMKTRTLEIAELENYKIIGLLVWGFILGPACEIIYRKFLSPSWGHKSSAIVVGSIPELLP